MKFLSYVVVLFLALSVVTTGCSSKKEAVDNQETSITETSEENEVVEETETETSEDPDRHGDSIDDNKDSEGNNVVANRNAEWPKDIPSFIPRLKGHIAAVIDNTKGDLVNYSLMYDKISPSDRADFKKQIESNPEWTIVQQMETEVRWIIMATNEKQNAEIKVIAVIGEVAKDEASGGIEVTFNK